LELSGERRVDRLRATACSKGVWLRAVSVSKAGAGGSMQLAAGQHEES